MISEVGVCEFKFNLFVGLILFVYVEKFVMELVIILFIFNNFFLVKIFRVNVYFVFGVK